ncbi:hypothetical protein ElyMa_006458000 [Elysia marginata]|uniref:Uncharacterized protein n=1 Tax=Elysia marginata TaxID=1093978 RepID=A0AAV4HXM8_9GAST|nr:hypothetical protein ElyMa_006458000 [Elysia marginata]
MVDVDRKLGAGSRGRGGGGRGVPEFCPFIVGKARFVYTFTGEQINISPVHCWSPKDPLPAGHLSDGLSWRRGGYEDLIIIFIPRDLNDLRQASQHSTRQRETTHITNRDKGPSASRSASQQQKQVSLPRISSEPKRPALVVVVFG